MITSIGKISKSFFVKLLVGIIILPFVFWGMGDVFRGGNQNVIATIDSNKLSTQEFVNYLNRLNLNNEQIKNLPKTSLVEEILSQYIGKKVMSLEIEKLAKLCYVAEIDLNNKAIGAVIQKEWNIKVVPTIIILKEGVEVMRYEPGISMRFNQQEVFDKIKKEIK